MLDNITVNFDFKSSMEPKRQLRYKPKSNLYRILDTVRRLSSTIPDNINLLVVLFINCSSSINRT